MNNHQESTLFLTTKKENKPFHKLLIHWSQQDIENFLVVFHGKGGNLSGLLLSDKHEFAITCTGCQREEIYTVHVYGLKKESTRAETTILYSVKASGKGTIEHFSHNDCVEDCLQTSVVLLQDAAASTPDEFLINTLKVNLKGPLDDATGLEVVITQTPPLEYTIFPQLSLEQEVMGLTAVHHVQPVKHSLIVSTKPLVQGMPVLAVSKSRTLTRVRVLTTCNRLHCPVEDSMVTTYQGCRNSPSKVIRACMVQEDLLNLLQMARTYCNTHTKYPWSYDVTQFYRNEPQNYYQDIFVNRSGIMEKYIKDNNGDPYSPINNQINGLFFSASINPFTREPPNFSYYGDTRLFIPVEEMFTPNTNIYFTDFYCHYETHYVTLVLTKQGSAEDQYCQGRLIQMDPRDNPFFWIEEIHIPASQQTPKVNSGPNSVLITTPGPKPSNMSTSSSNQSLIDLLDHRRLNAGLGLPDMFPRDMYCYAPMYEPVQISQSLSGCHEGAMHHLPVFCGHAYRNPVSDNIMQHHLSPVCLPVPCFPNGYIPHSHVHPSSLGDITEQDYKTVQGHGNMIKNHLKRQNQSLFNDPLLEPKGPEASETEKAGETSGCQPVSSGSQHSPGGTKDTYTDLLHRQKSHSIHNNQCKTSHLPSGLEGVSPCSIDVAGKTCNPKSSSPLPDKHMAPEHQSNTARSLPDYSKSSVHVKKTFKTLVVNKFHVEFLYTENIDILGLMRKHGNQKVYFQYVEGRGQSRKDGIPKRADCPMCNLPPGIL